mmetsp:Transcript_29090/g.36057  ORF Transcript_29090/g.36057 Transcript_29090/m.36057 type:complete len:81 (+) Transcript_29090:930-1172(+)|eukprot:CAMPEP_0170470136 /NCGR_PEP_ID=MMETSP0123-20130129/12698_1 /TAXON_ID=182087 /ORGANISM="Favella ehrenbergii, Strain Fehren 1" /LENGTH=80 /DNA_ID=CAMNT_0010737167 /DNA_START=890 /DNA_END=1132 /DNA_ORIENTATION=+
MKEMELSPIPTMLAEVEGIDPNADGVPVMRIGLNDPDKKSVVMSRTEFSAVELGEVDDYKPSASKKKQKKSKQGRKMSSQ